MRYCGKCDSMKDESEFPKNSWYEICSQCATRARENFYNRVKSGETCKHTRPAKKVRYGAPKKPENGFQKRCPHCNTHVWAVQTEKVMACWKCGKEIKITDVGEASTYHLHGLILQR